MITTTLGTLVVAEDALVRLRARPLAPVVAYRVSLLLAQVRERLVHYQTIHSEIVKELGAERAASNGERVRFGPTVVQVTDNNLETFRTRLQALHAEPVRLDLSPLRITDLGDALMTPADMDVLSVLLTHDAEGSTHG